MLQTRILPHFSYSYDMVLPLGIFAFHVIPNKYIPSLQVSYLTR